MTYPCCRFYIRIFAPLLATVLAVLVARAGFTNDKFSEVEIAPTAQNAPAAPAASAIPVTPATPTASTPPPAPAAAKATATANPTKTEAPALEVAAPKAKYLAGEDPEYAKRYG